MLEIWQSATGVNIILGPFISKTDGFTPLESVDLTTADSAFIFKHGATSASYSIDSATWSNMGSGYYTLAATTSMFDTLGQCRIAVNDVSIMLPYWMDMMVISTANWNYKYASTGMANMTVGSVSGSVLVRGTGAGAFTASSFAAGAIASSGNVASVVWDATASTHALTTSYGLVLGGMPSTTTLASAVMAVVGKTEYLPSATLGVASLVWSALSSSFGGAGTFGGIVGAMAAGADPWSSTVTNYTATNTFGLILGGLPSATTLASVIAGIAGKTSYLSSATVGDWALTASVSGSVYAMASNVWGKVTYQPSATVGDYTIASMTGSVYALGNNIWNKATYLPSITMGSWSISGVASVSGSVFGLASSIWGNVDYLPSLTVGDWPLTASVSGSVYGMASTVMGKIAYIPSATVENWTIASVSNSTHIGITDVGSVTGNLLLSVVGGVIGTVASVSVVGNIVGTIASVSVVGIVASVSGSIAGDVVAIYNKLPTKYYLTGTNELDGDLEMASVVGDFPNNLTGMLASISGSIRANIASSVWAAASSSFGGAGTFGGILGAMAAGADPWLTTVTAYTGTNTFGLLLGGLPSTTTLASSIYNVCVRTGGISVSAFGVGAIANTTQVASSIWTAATADYATASSMGHALGDAAAGGDPWGSTVTAYTGTNTFGLLLSGLPSTTTLASAVMAAVGKTYYLPSATLGSAGALLRAGTNQMASFNWEGSLTGNLATAGTIASTVWAAATADWATASSMGGALGDLAAGADPWASTVTGYVGTNTFGLILGGIPSATTLASVVAGVAGKTAYLPSATVNDWTIGSASGAGSDPWAVTVTGYVGTNTFGLILGGIPSATTLASVVAGVAGKTSYLPSITVGSWSISGVASVSIGGTMASVSGSLWGMVSSDYGKISYLPSVTIGSWSISGVASVSIVGYVASVSGSMWGVASTMWGKISYLPSVTIGSWSISGVASASVVGYVASVSGSAWGVLSTTYGKIDYLPSVTMGSWSISYANSVSFVGYAASVSGSAWGVLSTTYGKIDYLPSVTMGSWSISAVASVSVAGILASVSASVVDAFFEEVVEGTTTFRTSQKYQNAFVAGEATGGGTATVTIRDLADTLDRLKYDVDADGNRTAMTKNDG